MNRLVDIDNYLVLENGTIKETSFKQDIQIQNQTLMINEYEKVKIIYNRLYNFIKNKISFT